MIVNQKSAKTILRLGNLKKKLKISGSSVYNKLNSESKYFDITFPKPIRLGASSVGWLESEVDDWIEARIKDSRAT